MATRSEFIQRQHDEVRDTLEKLRQHAPAFEEKVQETEDEEDKAEWQGLAADAKAGIAALEPVLADFDNAGVDPEELIQYAQTIEHWQMKEQEFAERLAK